MTAQKSVLARKQPCGLPPQILLGVESVCPSFISITLPLRKLAITSSVDCVAFFFLRPSGKPDAAFY